MKKYTVSLLVGMMFFLGTATFSHAFGGSDSWINKDVQLTEEQKQEMAQMQMEALEQKKKIINKYVEYGVISEKKAEKIVSKFEKHYSKIEENGFIPKWDKHDKHHNKCDCDKEE
ncbi:YckD family protein [Bacillus alkalisoli]|uniref:YckD family protein n=1 Tax=Bacillus alkalisoli TaxID=2011008 RepID=UPI000C23D1FF|nr:YckD family protein [Bacillus alkalisoli]